MLLRSIGFSLSALSIPEFWQQAVNGALLLRRDQRRPARHPAPPARRPAERPMSLASHFNGTGSCRCCVVLTLIVGSFQNENFLTTGNMTFLIQSIAEIMLIAFAMTLADHRRRDRPLGLVDRGAVELLARLLPGSTPAACRWPWSPRSSTGVALRRVQRLPRDAARAAVAGRHDRHARPLPRPLLRAARRRPAEAVPDRTSRALNYRGIAGTWVPYVTVLLVVFGLVFGIVAARDAVRPARVRDRPDARRPRASPASRCDASCSACSSSTV